MLLILHIVIALGSLGTATVAVVAPARRKLVATYSLIIATLTSGTVLVIQTHAPLQASCRSGLLYVAVACSLAAVAEHRLKQSKI